MPTIRVEIGPKHLREASNAAAHRQFTSGDPLIFADVVEKGLQLRVQASSVHWLLRWSGKTRSLGGLIEVPNSKLARERAQRVRALLRDGVDPKAFLTGKGTGKTDEDAEASAKRHFAVTSGFWTWRALVAEYADGYLANPRLSRGRLKPPSLNSAKSAKAALTIPECHHLQDRLLSELSAGDLEEVRDQCASLGRKTASRAFVSYAKAALSFARKKHARRSGLEGASRWWMELAVLDSTAVAPRERMPSLEDIARTLYVAEKYRVIEGRKYNRPTSEIVLCGLWWLVFTAQRTTAAFSLERAHILPWPHGPKGWKIVVWSEDVMKSRRYHSLPIPPQVALVLDRASLTARTGSRYAFPATSVKIGEDAHLNKNTPKSLLERLRGKRSDPRFISSGPDSVDLLEGVLHFSPHDIRRTFATVCGDLAVRGDAVSAVLDHAGLETGQKMMRSADITRLAYDYSQRLELKRIAMEAWTNAVLEATDRVWATELGKPRTSESWVRLQQDKMKRRVTDLSRGVGFSELKPWYAIMKEMTEMEIQPSTLTIKRSATHDYDVDLSE